MECQVLSASLRILCLAGLLVAAAIVFLRSEQDLQEPGLVSDQLFDVPIGDLENALLAFDHLNLLFSIVHCFKLLGRHHERALDLFANTQTRRLRSFGMLLIGLGAMAVYWLAAGLTPFPSDSPAPSSLPAAPALYLAGLVLGAALALRGRWIVVRAEGAAVDEINDRLDAGRRLLPEADVLRIRGKLEKALDQDRLYRDPDLTLRQLSDAVGVSEHRVSEVLNQHLATNFYDFVNGRRIAEAKLILQQDGDRAVLDVAIDVGFNSKSTFYAAFKKVTDQSPVAFRRSMPAALCEVVSSRSLSDDDVTRETGTTKRLSAQT